MPTRRCATRSKRSRHALALGCDVTEQEDVERLVWEAAFLAASAAAYIIGQTIVVDGGATAW